MQHEFPRGIEVVTGTIVRNKKREILLVTSPKWQGKWVIPGGHVEPGERIMDAAVREAKEETGLDVTFVSIMQFQEFINPPDFHRKIHFISFLCVLDATSEEVLPDAKEISGYQWVRPEDALPLPLTRDLAKTIEEYIIKYP